MKNEIIIYQPDTADIQLEVRVGEDSVWLNLDQIALLFERDKSVISRHITNIFKEGELEKVLVVAKFATTNKYGRRQGFIQTKDVVYYNLDVIISVGYRVKSLRGVQFRRWATAILKEHLLRGYSIRQELQHLEDKLDRRLAEHSQVLKEHQNKIDFILKTELKPTQGVFFQGQIFDAYVLFEKIIGEAKNEIILIDNYVDLSVLERFAKKKNGVKITIFTNTKTAISPLDVEKFNAQYGNLELKFTEKVHDRFLIIDENEIYHLGASLKDLGKKCFAFSVMEKDWIGKILQEVFAY